jgi:hypothetical protein
MLQECMRLLNLASNPEPETGSGDSRADGVDLTGSPVRAAAPPATAEAPKAEAEQPAQTAAAAAAAMQMSFSRMLFDPSKIETYRQILLRQVKPLDYDASL